MTPQQKMAQSQLTLTTEKTIKNEETPQPVMKAMNSPMSVFSVSSNLSQILMTRPPIGKPKGSEEAVSGASISTSGQTNPSRNMTNHTRTRSAPPMSENQFEGMSPAEALAKYKDKLTALEIAEIS